MKKAIVLISHGNMAKEALVSTEMIMGKSDCIFAVCMEANDGLEKIITKMEGLLLKLNEFEEVLVLADLLGGTPCNVATLLSQKYEKLHVIGGFNLNMILEALINIHLPMKELKELIVNNSKENIKDINKSINL